MRQEKVLPGPIIEGEVPDALDLLLEVRKSDLVRFYSPTRIVCNRRIEEPEHSELCTGEVEDVPRFVHVDVSAIVSWPVSVYPLRNLA
jgi:hypothetical protein